MVVVWGGGWGRDGEGIITEESFRAATGGGGRTRAAVGGVGGGQPRVVGVDILTRHPRAAQPRSALKFRVRFLLF